MKNNNNRVLFTKKEKEAGLLDLFLQFLQSFNDTSSANYFDIHVYPEFNGDTVVEYVQLNWFSDGADGEKQKCCPYVFHL